MQEKVGERDRDQLLCREIETYVVKRSEEMLFRVRKTERESESGSQNVRESANQREKKRDRERERQRERESE